MARSAAVASDDFNRAAPLGANWANLNSDWGVPTINAAGTRIVTNSANTVRSLTRWVGAGSFNNDQWASIRVYPIFQTSGYACGVAVRCSADTNAARDAYTGIVLYDAAGPNYTTQLVKIVNGTRTTLHSASVAWTAGDRIDLEVEGTTLRLCKNGTPLGGSFTVTDTDLSTGLPGIEISGTSTTAEGDDWEAGNFELAISQTPPPYKRPRTIAESKRGFKDRITNIKTWW